MRRKEINERTFCPFCGKKDCGDCLEGTGLKPYALIGPRGGLIKFYALASHDQLARRQLEVKGRILMPASDAVDRVVILALRKEAAL